MAREFTALACGPWATLAPGSAQAEPLASLALVEPYELLGDTAVPASLVHRQGQQRCKLHAALLLQAVLLGPPGAEPASPHLLAWSSLPLSRPP